MDLPSRIGRYEVELLIGEGGCGRVFLARDPVLRRQVALKVLRDDLFLTPAQHQELSTQLREEVRAASTLSHPAIVALHDMGDDDRFGLYMVFELVRGATLRERLHDGPLSPPEVAQMARSLGGALAYAHAAGLVHRGVKPENVMLAHAGPKLVDFGISRVDPNAPAYSAPEVISSDVFGPAADQFSLAATMYEALTGRRAFPGEDPQAVILKIVSGKHAAPLTVLPTLRGRFRLDAVFARGMAKNPGKRFPSCEAFASALTAELEGPHVTFLATPAHARSSFTRATRRWQNGIALGAVVVIFALLAIGRRHKAEDRPGGAAQRVTLPSRDVTPSALPAASATSLATPGMSVLSPSVPGVAP